MADTIVLLLFLLAAIAAFVGMVQSPRSGGAWALFLLAVAFLAARYFGLK